MVGLADIPFVGKFVERISENTVDAVFRGLKYMFCYKALVDKLNSETGKLNIQMDNLSRKIQEEKDNGKIIKDYVLKWQDDAEEIKKSAKEYSPSCSCIKILPIPNPVSRFRIGRNAAKKAIAVAYLTGTGKDHLTEGIAHLPPVENIPRSDSTFEEFQSRKDIYQKLYDALVNKDSPLVHGIYGMPGVGKTRMMEKFWEEAMKEKIFNKVVRVNVGNENMDKIKLQDQIAGRLNCHLDSQDLEQRASQLENSLRNGGKILLILDDVWTEIRLGDIIGTSFGNGSGSKGSKILFTSREKVVLKRNKCEHLVEIKTLSPGEALYLFQTTVGPDTINSLQDESLVQDVCIECGHLPLLIHAVGKALKGEPHNSWKDAHDQLKTGKFERIAGIDPQVYACIKLSIDNLKEDDAKSCLFLCCFFPEDANIDMEMLIQLATGSQLIPEGESRILAMVHYLKISSLLLDSGKDNETKVHDIIRDVARSIAFTDSKYAFLQVTCPSGYLPSNANYRSRKFLRLDAEAGDVQFYEDLVCSDLHTLWLQSNYHPQQFAGGFFRMFVNLSFLMLQNVKISPERFSLQPLENLGMLTLLGCNIKKTDVSLFPKNLKTLCICHCSFPQPLDVSNLKYLLKLEVKCGNFVMKSNAISSLSSLKELHIPKGFIIDNEGYNMEPIVLEISKLTHLRSLQFDFVRYNTFQGTNVFSNIDKYNISVGDRDMSHPRKQRRRVLSTKWIELYGEKSRSWDGLIARADKVRLVYSDIEVSSICNSHRRAFEDLKALCIENCDKMGSLASISQDEIHYSPRLATCFSKLTILTIVDCDRLKYLFCNNNAKSMVQLQELTVHGCKSMEAIILNDGTSLSHDEIQPATYFSKLTILDIHNCSKLKYIFCSNIAKSMLQLQELSVSRCESMEAIILNEGTSISQHEIQQATCFSKLTLLKISQCHQLKYLFCNNIAKSMVQLQVLSVEWCESMEAIILNDGTHEGEITNFPELKTLKISFMSGLRSFRARKKNMHPASALPMDDSAPLFDKTVAFPFLEELDIYGLPYTSIIWGKDCFNSDSLSSYCKLNHLTVRCCHKLEILIPQAILLRLNYLESIYVYKCSNLRTMFPSSVTTALTHLKELKVDDCENMTEIIEAGEQVITDDGILFPELAVLKLVGLPSLTSFCCYPSGKANTCKVTIRLLQLSSIDLKYLPALKSFFHDVNFEFHMPALKQVTVHGCELSTLFTFSMFRQFQLENLKVIDCELLENIVEDLRGDEICDKIITLSQLREVNLSGLPNLKDFFHNVNYEFQMPVMKKVIRHYRGVSNTMFTRSVFKNLKLLEELSALYSELLESIFEDAAADETLDTSDKIIPLNQLSTVRLDHLPKCRSIFYGATYQCYMPALKNVTIVGCGLSVLFTCSVFQELQQLKELYVSDCESLEHIVEEVVGDETSATKGKCIKFPELTSITVASLPNLRSFSCSPSYVFNMPKLYVLKLRECPQIEYFSSSKTNTPEVRVITGRECEEVVQDLNDYIRENYSSQVGILSERFEEAKPH